MKRKPRWAVSLVIIAITVFLIDANVNITHATNGTTHIAIYNIVGIALILLLLVIAIRKRK